MSSPVVLLLTPNRTTRQLLVILQAGHGRLLMNPSHTVMHKTSVCSVNQSQTKKVETQCISAECKNID
jgi:hypothetical protein